MFKTLGKVTFALLVGIGLILISALFSSTSNSEGESPLLAQDAATSTTIPTETPLPTETIPPYTPLPTLTPTQTLKPPPTFEPPTATPTASTVPTITSTPTTSLNVSVPGLRGAESPTPTSTPGCEPRPDWQLTYTVKFDDTLSAIADIYGTWPDTLADGNCIMDKNLISIGQVLRVPGEAHPVVPEYDCVAWELYTPFNGMTTVPTTGSLTFNWRGPVAPKYLIRIHRPDGSQYEQLVELRQSDTINVMEQLSQGGQYTWYVYPLGNDFLQIPCTEGGPWVFYKEESPT